MINKGNSIVVIIVGIVIAVVAIVGFAFLRPSETNSPSSGNGLAEDTSVMKDETVPMTNNPNTLVAVLEDVSGGNSSGTGYVLREGALTHTVEANLPDPEGTMFYEGWLVQQSPLAFISTGDMVRETDGEYSLTHENSNLYEDYDFVVITLETIKDNTPEKHIIEGIAI